MKQSVLGLVLGFLVAAPALAGVEVRAVEESFELAPDRALRVDVPVAEIEVAGVAGDEVRVEMTIECPRRTRGCEEEAEELSLEVKRRESSVVLSVEGYPKGTSRAPEVTLTLHVPASRAFELELGVGSVEVRGLEGDLTLDVGVGDVDVTMAEASVASVRLDVGVGDADLKPRHRDLEESSSFVGNEISWKGGPGAARVRLEVGVGDVDLRLE